MAVRVLATVEKMTTFLQSLIEFHYCCCCKVKKEMLMEVEEATAKVFHHKNLFIFTGKPKRKK